MDDWQTNIIGKLGGESSGMASPGAAPQTLRGMAGPSSSALPPGQWASPTGFKDERQAAKQAALAAKLAARAARGPGKPEQGFMMNPKTNPVAGIYNPGGWCD